MRLSIFDNAFVRGVNFYGTLSGPMNTYRVPQIPTRGLGEWEICRVFGKFPNFPNKFELRSAVGRLSRRTLGRVDFFEMAHLSFIDSHRALLTLLWRRNEVRGLNWGDVVHVNNLSLRNDPNTRKTP